MSGQLKLDTRKIDDLNRIILPKSATNLLGWAARMPLDILVDQQNACITLQAALPRCAVCGAHGGDCRLTPIKSAHLCPACLTAIQESPEPESPPPESPA